MAWRIGVDSGGTFTDICLFDEASGTLAVWKVASTSADPSRAVAEGVAEPFVQENGGLRAGQTVEIVTPGAGGYGTPASPIAGAKRT